MVSTHLKNISQIGNLPQIGLVEYWVTCKTHQIPRPWPPFGDRQSQVFLAIPSWTCSILRSRKSKSIFSPIENKDLQTWPFFRIMELWSHRPKQLPGHIQFLERSIHTNQCLASESWNVPRFIHWSGKSISFIHDGSVPCWNPCCSTNIAESLVRSVRDAGPSLHDVPPWLNQSSGWTKTIKQLKSLKSMQTFLKLIWSNLCPCLYSDFGRSLPMM